MSDLRLQPGLRSSWPGPGLLSGTDHLGYLNLISSVMAHAPWRTRLRKAVPIPLPVAVTRFPPLRNLMLQNISPTYPPVAGHSWNFLKAKNCRRFRFWKRPPAPGQPWNALANINLDYMRSKHKI